MDYDVCRDEDVPDGVLRTFEIAGEKLLIARVDGECHAVGATCPHAGAPLGEGVLHDGVVVCPWHKAAFRLRTGEHVEPPAVDDLPRYPLRLVDGRLRVDLGAAKPEAQQPGPGAIDKRCMAVVGAGAAGAVAAQTLRRAGFAGRVVLISREDRLPYDRTLLSKYTLSGQQGGEKTPLQDAAFYRKHRIERVTGEVRLLDPAARTLTFADGQQLAYDAALVATGGTPRALSVPGHDLPGVHLLRTPDDADAIVADAASARQVVVVGAGFIGLEAAGSLRERGLDVAVVAPQREPLERQLGAEIGRAFRQVHERQGVVFHLGEDVAAIEGAGRVERVRLKSGAVLPAQLVVAGTGIVPATAFVQSVPRREDAGFDVDAELRVVDGLYAAGDVAAFPLYGRSGRARVEHWRVAEQHGRIAALNMLGHGVAYEAVPYFWTIHYMQRLDYVGHAPSWTEIIVDGDVDAPEFTAFYVAEGIVRAVAMWGRDTQATKAITLLNERQDWPVAELRRALG
jgi:NADPH-dependent 2,4-dienoyl-CoA reductase/sulfur reductase-like enzyme/nitrite reductase/ring-hydroxylating ferredoxin subunit